MSSSQTTLPTPRAGFTGLIDRLAGPGATPAELTLQFGVAFAAATAAGSWYALTADGRWWMVAIAVLPGLDVGEAIVVAAWLAIVHFTFAFAGGAKPLLPQQGSTLPRLLETGCISPARLRRRPRAARRPG